MLYSHIQKAFCQGVHNLHKQNPVEEQHSSELLALPVRRGLHRGPAAGSVCWPRMQKATASAFPNGTTTMKINGKYRLKIPPRARRTVEWHYWASDSLWSQGEIVSNKQVLRENNVLKQVPNLSWPKQMIDRSAGGTCESRRLSLATSDAIVLWIPLNFLLFFPHVTWRNCGMLLISAGNAKKYTVPIGCDLWLFSRELNPREFHEVGGMSKSNI